MFLGATPVESYGSLLDMVAADTALMRSGSERAAVNPSVQLMEASGSPISSEMHVVVKQNVVLPVSGPNDVANVESNADTAFEQFLLWVQSEHDKLPSEG